MLRNIKQGIDCEAMFVALPRKVDTMLPRAAERTLPAVVQQCLEQIRHDIF
jgi:hypothetical protein